MYGFPREKRKNVYRNLHRDCWSVRERGKKVCHETEGIYILRECRFLVQQAGLERVRKEERKNVHAFVSGYEAFRYLPKVHPHRERIMDSGVEVTYNPYKYDSFVIKETEQPIFKAKTVAFTEDGRVFAIL